MNPPTYEIAPERKQKIDEFLNDPRVLVEAKKAKDDDGALPAFKAYLAPRIETLVKTNDELRYMKDQIDSSTSVPEVFKDIEVKQAIVDTAQSRLANLQKEMEKWYSPQTWSPETQKKAGNIAVVGVVTVGSFLLVRWLASKVFSAAAAAKEKAKSAGGFLMKLLIGAGVGVGAFFGIKWMIDKKFRDAAGALAEKAGDVKDAAAKAADAARDTIDDLSLRGRAEIAKFAVIGKGLALFYSDEYARADIKNESESDQIGPALQRLHLEKAGDVAAEGSAERYISEFGTSDEGLKKAIRFVCLVIQKRHATLKPEEKEKMTVGRLVGRSHAALKMLSTLHTNADEQGVLNPASFFRLIKQALSSSSEDVEAEMEDVGEQIRTLNPALVGNEVKFATLFLTSDESLSSVESIKLGGEPLPKELQDGLNALKKWHEENGATVVSHLLQYAHGRGNMEEKLREAHASMKVGTALRLYLLLSNLPKNERGDLPSARETDPFIAVQAQMLVVKMVGEEDADTGMQMRNMLFFKGTSAGREAVTGLAPDVNLPTEAVVILAKASEILKNALLKNIADAANFTWSAFLEGIWNDPKLIGALGLGIVGLKVGPKIAGGMWETLLDRTILRYSNIVEEFSRVGADDVVMLRKLMKKWHIPTEAQAKAMVGRAFSIFEKARVNTNVFTETFYNTLKRMPTTEQLMMTLKGVTRGFIKNLEAASGMSAADLLKVADTTPIVQPESLAKAPVPTPDGTPEAPKPSANVADDLARQGANSADDLVPDIKNMPEELLNGPATPEALDVAKKAGYIKNIRFLRQAALPCTLGAVISGALICQNEADIINAEAEGKFAEADILRQKRVSLYIEGGISIASGAAFLVSGPVGWVTVGGLVIVGLANEMMYERAKEYSNDDADYRNESDEILLQKILHWSNGRIDSSVNSTFIAAQDGENRQDFLNANAAIQESALFAYLKRNQKSHPLSDEDLELVLAKYRETNPNGMPFENAQEARKALQSETYAERLRARILVGSGDTKIASEKLEFLMHRAKERGGDLSKLLPVDLEMADMYTELMFLAYRSDLHKDPSILTKGIVTLKQKYAKLDIDLIIPDTQDLRLETMGPALERMLYKNYDKNFEESDLVWAFRGEQLLSLVSDTQEMRRIVEKDPSKKQTAWTFFRQRFETTILKNHFAMANAIFSTFGAESLATLVERRLRPLFESLMDGKVQADIMGLANMQRVAMELQKAFNDAVSSKYVACSDDPSSDLYSESYAQHTEVQRSGSHYVR